MTALMCDEPTEKNCSAETYDKFLKEKTALF